MRVEQLENQFVVEVLRWDIVKVKLPSTISSQEILPKEIVRIGIQGTCFPPTDEVHAEVGVTGDESTCLQVFIGDQGPFLKQLLG